MKYALLLFTLTLGLISCSKQQDFPKFHLEAIQVDDLIIPDTITYQSELDVTFKYTLPNSCYYYNDLYYVANDSVRTTAIIAYVDEEAICTQATKEEEVTIHFKVEQEEDYIFKLYKGVDEDNKSIYEEKIVRVIEEDEVQ
ncbi:hypothetical protein [Wenyingzhuangia aestuarii]|uniref:hypothetical protein n=1 Tax=Wenyingzhuangia aestuarii TaxID=1647582 RepID=UPI00143A6253|nr:hypothetical protein [Wenyingzhuangia aestuarii]NJB82127.1 hypothetical protein [Wenyingzhuangia aestuarii]